LHVPYNGPSEGPLPKDRRVTERAEPRKKRPQEIVEEQKSTEVTDERRRSSGSGKQSHSGVEQDKPAEVVDNIYPRIPPGVISEQKHSSDGRNLPTGSKHSTPIPAPVMRDEPERRSSRGKRKNEDNGESHSGVKNNKSAKVFDSTTPRRNSPSLEPRRGARERKRTRRNSPSLEPRRSARERKRTRRNSPSLEPRRGARERKRTSRYAQLASGPTRQSDRLQNTVHPERSHLFSPAMVPRHLDRLQNTVHPERSHLFSLATTPVHPDRLIRLRRNRDFSLSHQQSRK
jgi:hypothetical protein